MTADDFRAIALELPDAEEREHMHHPDFRVRGRIFATLGYPSAEWAMLKLTPAEQQLYVTAHPDVFLPIKGAWGARGATNVRLRAATKRIVRDAVAAAWRNTASTRRAAAAARRRP